MRPQLGGATNLQCCQNIDALVGPYPDAALHNCLCLPGQFELLEDSTFNIGARTAPRPAAAPRPGARKD